MINNSYTNSFTVKFRENKIVGSKASFKKASKINSPQYEELTAILKEHPDFQLVEKEQKSNSSKRTYKGLNEKTMRYFIETRHSNDLEAFDSMLKNAKETKINAYPIIKKWFINRYGVNGKFDMSTIIIIDSETDNTAA